MRQVSRQAVLSLKAQNDRDGPHINIRQIDLRVLWRHCFNPNLKVEWCDFWGVFPEDLTLPEISMNPQRVAHLKQLFDDPGSRLRFQQLLRRADPSTVGVMELKRLPAEDDLVQVVEALMGVAGTPAPGGGTQAASSLLPPQTQTASCSSNFRLPPVDAYYCGREEDAERVIGLLTHRLQQPALTPCADPQAPGLVVLVAQGGMGKSCLALDVGWQLQRQGGLGGGALLVDLRPGLQARWRRDSVRHWT